MAGCRERIFSIQLQRRRKHVALDCASSSSIQAGAWGTKAQMPREASLAPGALTKKFEKN